MKRPESYPPSRRRKRGHSPDAWRTRDIDRLRTYVGPKRTAAQRPRSKAPKWPAPITPARPAVTTA